MLIPRTEAIQAYHLIRDQARRNRSAVLILVAAECDAIASCHIFTSFLRTDDIAFTINPVHSYGDIIKFIQERDSQSYQSIVLFNCGATVDLEARLGLSDEQWGDSRIVVVDSHRPFHFNNIYFDRNPVVDDDGNSSFQDRIEDAKVILINVDENISDQIPVFEDAVLFDEDFDDYEDDDRTPAHRRRVGDADESSGISDEEIFQQELAILRRKREANLRIEMYSSKYCRSEASALLMFSLSVDLQKDTNEILWWGIIGMTEQFINNHKGLTEYESALRIVAEEVSRLNPDDGRPVGNVGKISLVHDFKFMLLRFWSLYESMYYTEYVASNLQLWKDRKNDSNQLITLLASTGIRRSEAEQNFLSMKSSIQEDLAEKLETWAETFKIPDYLFATFHKTRHFAHHISAADCVHVTSAMLNRPPPSTGKWQEWFYQAYDAIQWCSSRESLWDELLENPVTVTHAVELQKVVLEKAFEILSTKPLPIGSIGVSMGGFRYLRIPVDDSAALLAQPMTLRKIGCFIAQNQVKNRKSRNYRLIVGAENHTSGDCTVVGIECTSSSGFQPPNMFGKLFQMVIKEQSDIIVTEDLFDNECLKFSNCTFLTFVSLVNSAQDRLYEHEQYFNRLLGDDDEAQPENP